MTDKEKLSHYLDVKGITKAEFSRTTGFSASFLLSGSTLGVDRLAIIVKHYPDLNLNWLFFGEGEPVKEEVTEEIEMQEIAESALRSRSQGKEATTPQSSETSGEPVHSDTEKRLLLKLLLESEKAKESLERQVWELTHNKKGETDEENKK